jgi:hypothetical protein
MQGSNSAQASAAKDPSNPSNPLKSSDSSASKSDSTSTASADGDKGAAGGGFKSAAIDPALRKLMEDELAYEPADKRQAVFDQWAKFDPSFIRELIENHRMARELAESHRGNTEWAGTGAGGSNTKSGNDSKIAKSGSTDAAPGLPFDDPSAPKDSVLRERTAAAAPVQSTTPPAPGAVSPWEDTPNTTSTASQGRTTTTPVAATTRAQSAALPAAPVAPAANSAVAKSDPWDSDSAPPKQAPVAPSPTSPPQSGTTAAPSPTAMPVTTPSPPRADAFAGLAPIDTDPPGTPKPQTPGPAAPKVAASGNSASPSTSAGENPFGDGPVIQPGTSSSQPSSRGAGGSVTQAVASGAVDATGVALASASTPAAPNQPGAESEQPVKLSLPVDVPDGQVVAASDSASTGTRAAQASATGSAASPAQPTATTPTQQPSGLASLPGRLLGAINPLPGAGGSRNVSLPANWHDELQKIVSSAATEAGQTSVGSSDAEKLAYIQKQVNLRMLYLLSGQPARSLEPIAGLDPADQEFWQEVFWGMSSYFDRTTIADPRDRATQTIAQLRQAVHKLQEKSKLELRNVAFCNKIENYGRYERFKRDEFTAGQPVLLYAEVENFKSESTADGPYRAILKSTIEIFDTSGKLVRSMPFAPNEDLCSSPRRDYYNSYEFSIPQEISLGPHTLKLTVEDQLSQKVASYTVNFTVK